MRAEGVGRGGAHLARARTRARVRVRVRVRVGVGVALSKWMRVVCAPPPKARCTVETAPTLTLATLRPVR